jgi:hypothetical protein
VKKRTLKDRTKMQPSLCKKHFREVSNVFDKETAFAYELNEKDCVICNKIIFIEGARRFVHSPPVNASEEALRLPNAFAQLRA